ncbi:hypothetical protein GCM10020221_26030 [Streptomyces thioluteus]|uniref:Uncharacterized protein n=1 Tax=Streptomyces thioluteus TaxID=66431 RepID=A0ABN3WVU2_STRTU
MPVEARYASAFFATFRGSRLYCSPVIGSWMKKLMFSVLSRRNGSMRAVGKVGAQGHVGLVDGLEAADRRAVEGQLLGRVERLRGDREVLHHARQVAETDIDELDVLVLDELLGVVAVLEHPTLLARPPAVGDCFGGAAADPRETGFPGHDPFVSPRLTGPRPKRDRNARPKRDDGGGVRS